jgi:aromatic ring-opening dioxygenase catalytic subunit (LigB family)
LSPGHKEFRDWVDRQTGADDEAALHAYRTPGAIQCAKSHPSDEHLLPLYFARGAGGQFSMWPTRVHAGSAGDGYLSVWLLNQRAFAGGAAVQLNGVDIREGSHKSQYK